MRYMWRGLAGILVLVVIVMAVVLMIPAERIARLAAEQFEKTTGRAMRIEGEVSPRFWPVLGVKTGPVTIANADWSLGEGPLFAADSVTIEVNASALLGGEVRILGISSERPRILLERSKDGQANWDFSAANPGSAPEGATETAAETASGTAPPAATATESASGATSGFTLEHGLIKGGTFRYLDHGSGRDVTFDNVDATLAIPDFTGPFTLSASASVSGQPVSLALEGGIFQAFAEGRVTPLKLDLSAGAARIGFDGRGSWNPMAAEGTLSADLSDLKSLAAAAGAGAPELPEGLGARKLALNSPVVLDSKGIYLRGARIEADNNTILGDLDLTQGEARPKLSGNLRATALDLRGLSGESAGSGDSIGGGAAGGMQAPGWPKDVIDVSGLGLSDASLSLAAGSVDLGLVKFGETQLLLSIDRARAVFDLRQMAAYGGSVSGEFVVNGRGGLSVGGNLALAGIDAMPLMQDIAGWDRLITKASLNLKFLGVGNSIDEIMQGLKGDGSLTLGKGEIRGLDIAGMLRTLDTSHIGEGQKTIFDGIAGTFTIDGGNLSNTDLRLVAPYLTATGSGRIGLGRRDLDYRIRPVAFPGEDSTGGVLVPLRITGSWASPTYRLDLESIAREKMEAEAKAAEERLKREAKEAEARAKAELEAKLKSELGVEAGAGESLEDAAKRRAREAVSQEAGRLLDGILGGN